MKKRDLKVKFYLHKGLYTLILLFLLSPLVHTSCRAEGESPEEQVRSGVEDILDDFDKILPDGYEEMQDIKKISERVGVKSILESVFNEISGQGTEISAFLLMLIGVVMIGALASLFSNEMGTISSRAVGVVASAMIFERLFHIVLGAVASLSEISNFFGALIPITVAVNSLGVSPTTATTQAVGMGFTLGVYSYIANKLIVPIVIAVFVTSAASSSNPLFGKIAKGVKDVFLWTVGIFSVLVGATFSLQSVISSGADNVVIRSTKYAITGTIPIVGNAVSGALGLVFSGASYARGLIGGGSVAVIITLVLSPLVTLLLYRICIKIGAFFASLCSLDGCASIISTFLGAIDTLIATYALTSVVYILELVAFLKGGAAVA